MFSFFAWISLIGGICGTVYNFYVYTILYQRDPWGIDNSTYLTNAIFFLFASLIVFAFYMKLRNMERDIDAIKEIIRDRPRASQANTTRQDTSTTTYEDARVAQNILLYAKYDAHIASITESVNAGRYQTYDLFYRDVFAPKDWRENTMGNRETWFALYDYYNKLLPLLIEWKSAQPLVNEVCEEAYRLTGFLGINLNGQNSDIMSYMCDVEQSANGNSQRLTTICKKLDSIGALDRGQPFGNRLR